MTLKALLLVAPLTSLLFAGCAPQLEGNPGGFDCESCDEGAPLEVIPGAQSEWYRCWVDEDTEATDDFFREDYVFCEMTPQARALDIQYVSIQLFTAEDGLGEVLIQADEPTVLVKKVNGPAYPLRLRSSVHLTNFDSTFSYEGINADYGMEHTIERSALPTKDAPLVVHQPFDLWPVEILVATRAVSLRFDSYRVELAGGMQSGDASSVDVSVRNQSSGRENDRMIVYLPVTSGTEEATFSGTGQFYRDSLPFTVTGVGSYVADADGLHAQ